MKVLLWVVIVEIIVFGIVIAVMAVLSADNNASPSQEKNKFYPNTTSEALVLLTDKKFVPKFEKTVWEVRNVGEWTGDIVCIHSTDLLDNKPFMKICHKLQIIPYFVPKLDLSKLKHHIKNNPFHKSDGREIHKTVQWLKLYLFTPYFKQWKVLFYIDAGMKIYSPITRFFNLHVPESKIMVHSDAYPTYVWKLSNQFDQNEKNANKAIYGKLSQVYDLQKDYFQTGIVMFRTSIINDTMFRDMIQLIEKYPIYRTNEQALMNLFFYSNWQQIPVKDDQGYLYDALSRKRGRKYAMLKYS